MDGIVLSIRADLRSAADSERAPAQQAYMKSEMPFLGVSVPVARGIAKGASKGVADAGRLRNAALTLWDEAEYREERYAAMALLVTRPVDADFAAIPLIEHMVRTGQWWDYTDELAHRLATLHDTEPAQTAELVRRWSRDEDFWIRRIAILSQLGRGTKVNRGLLAEVIEPNLADEEFFIRKAIGWALREYARVEPAWVQHFADTHELRPLSRREALKHLEQE